MHAAGLQRPPLRWGTTPPQPPALLHPAAASALQWNVTGDYVNSPFASPYPPYVIRTIEGTDPDRIVLVSGGGGSGGQWQLKAYEADSGAEAWSATVAAPDAANAGLTTLTSGLPHWQQLNNSLGLMFLQLGTYVVAVDSATGQQRWQHATYNASTPKITGYRCAAGAAAIGCQCCSQRLLLCLAGWHRLAQRRHVRACCCIMDAACACCGPRPLHTSSAAILVAACLPGVRLLPACKANTIPSHRWPTLCPHAAAPAAPHVCTSPPALSTAAGRCRCLSTTSRRWTPPPDRCAVRPVLLPLLVVVLLLLPTRCCCCCSCRYCCCRHCRCRCHSVQQGTACRRRSLGPVDLQVVWANFTSLPPASGLPTSDTAGMWGVTATPTAAVYAQGARLYGLSPDDGRQLWQIVVSAGAGTGLNPNVTSVAYVPVLDAVPSRQYPMLLLTSSTWDQTRFMAYQFNGSNATAAPTVAWQVRRGGW